MDSFFYLCMRIPGLLENELGWCNWSISLTFAGVNECDSMPCLHGGKCINLNTEDAGSGVGSGAGSGEGALHRCVCAAGYTGKLCEKGNEFDCNFNLHQR